MFVVCAASDPKAGALIFAPMNTAAGNPPNQWAEDRTTGICIQRKR